MKLKTKYLSIFLLKPFIVDNAYAIYTPFGTDFSPVYKYKIVGGERKLAVEDK